MKKTLLILFLLIAAYFGVNTWRHSSISALQQGLDEMEQQRREVASAALARLSQLTPAGVRTHVIGSIPAALLNDLAGVAKGAVYQDPGGWKIQVKTLTLKPNWGALEFEAAVTVSSGSLSLEATLGGHLIAATDPKSGLALQFRIARFVPTSAAIPEWAGPILSAETIAALNAVLPAVPLPIEQELALTSQPIAEQPIVIPTPNGSITGVLQLPPIPDLRRTLHLRGVIPSPSGIFLIAEPLSPQSTPRVVQEPATAAVEPNDSQFEAKWKEAMTKLSFPAELPPEVCLIIGGGVVESLISEVNSFPEIKRTVTYQSRSTQGDIMSKTGGAPFGNGFKLYLEGADRATASGVASSLSVAMAADKITLNARASVSAKAQVHFHGNAPQVTKRVFGIKIIDVKVGGGAGTSIGVSMGAKTQAARLELAFDAADNDFTLTLTEPNEVPISFNIGGVPGEIEKWMKDSIKVKLPTGKPLTRFAFPKIITTEWSAPTDGPFRLAQPLTVSAERPAAGTPTAQITPTGIVLKTKVKIGSLVPSLTPPTQ